MRATTKLRVGRPTDNFEAVIRFYKDGLGLTELYRFENHDGFDGIMLGSPGAAYHLEFSRVHGHVAGRAPNADSLLVFYLPVEDEWRQSVARMKGCGYQPVEPFNPYWRAQGVTFEDPDGYRVVLQRAAWER